MMQNHYVISSKYNFWTWNVPNWTKSLKSDMSGPVKTCFTIFFQLQFSQIPTAYLTHSTFAETASKLVPGRPISNSLEKCPQATPGRLGPPSRECAHPGGLTSSAQFRFVGPVGTWVEYSTQWSGKPLIPLGPAPGRNHMFKKQFRHK